MAQEGWRLEKEKCTQKLHSAHTCSRHSMIQDIKLQCLSQWNYGDGSIDKTVVDWEEVGGFWWNEYDGLE